MDIVDIPTIYINLNKRVDRKISILHELSKIGLKNITRFNAIEKSNGAIGCTFSHIKCLEIAIHNKYDYVFICEDDLLLLNPELFITNINKFLNSNINWDIVLVAGNNMLPFIHVNDFCIKIKNCLTTTGYIVKKHYYEKLIDNFKTGLCGLLKTPQDNTFRIDKYWTKLQKIDNWYMIIPPTIVQREDYSDIENKITNFKNYMLNYNKLIIN